MKSNTTYPGIGLIILFVAAAAIIRILFSYFPALANFSPVAAMALFGGYYFRDKRMAFALTMIIMLFSDLALQLAYMSGLRAFPGFHGSMPYVYLGFFAVVAVGTLLKNAKPLTLLGASLISSVAFFIVSNFGAWTAGHGYPMTWGGLIACYTAAIPFFRYTVAGDLVFVAMMFGSFEWVKSRYLTPATA